MKKYLYFCLALAVFAALLQRQSPVCTVQDGGLIRLYEGSQTQTEAILRDMGITLRPGDGWEELSLGGARRIRLCRESSLCAPVHRKRRPFQLPAGKATLGPYDYTSFPFPCHRHGSAIFVPSDGHGCATVISPLCYAFLSESAFAASIFLSRSCGIGAPLMRRRSAVFFSVSISGWLLSSSPSASAYSFTSVVIVMSPFSE